MTNCANQTEIGMMTAGAPPYAPRAWSGGESRPVRPAWHCANCFAPPLAQIADECGARHRATSGFLRPPAFHLKADIGRGDLTGLAPAHRAWQRITIGASALLRREGKYLISTPARTVAGGGEAVRAGFGEAQFLQDKTDIEFFTELKPVTKYTLDWATNKSVPVQADWPMPEGEYLNIRLQRIFNEDGTIDIFDVDTP